MKRFLLIAGDNYYPVGGTGDWIDTYATREEAAAQVVEVKHEVLFKSGPRKNQVKTYYSSYHLKDRGQRVIGWHEIVDLLDWIK